MEEVKSLELSLAPPGDQFTANNNINGAKRAFQNSCSSSSPLSPTKKEASINVSNKRVELAPVVGWPPIRSSRRNLSGNNHSSKLPVESAAKSPQKEKKKENQMYVKINMEGVPIGRKVNLSAYKSYQELSVAVGHLFSGLLAAKTSTSIDGKKEEKEKESKIKNHESGIDKHYTLIYEDNEGDRVLVGDVPWHMFISTVKRLLVLKTSEISSLPSSINGRERGPSVS